MRDLEQWAAARETSQEIAEAIMWLADQDEDQAQAIWEDPSYEQLLAIWERVTGNGNRPSTDYCYGASGSKWAREIDESRVVSTQHE